MFGIYGNFEKRLVRKYKPQDITNQSEMKLDGHEWIMAMLNTPTLTTQTQPLWVMALCSFPISSLPGFLFQSTVKVTRYLKSKR